MIIDLEKKKKIVIHSLKINSDPNFKLHDIKKL